MLSSPHCIVTFLPHLVLCYLLLPFEYSSQLISLPVHCDHIDIDIDMVPSLCLSRNQQDTSLADSQLGWGVLHFTGIIPIDTL